VPPRTRASRSSTNQGPRFRASRSSPAQPLFVTGNAPTAKPHKRCGGRTTSSKAATACSCSASWPNPPVTRPPARPPKT
jgi:hypothetical protein